MRSCWQIRQELSEKNGDSHKLNGWLMNCAGCTVNGGEQSCWEQCTGSPCCCAPIHVTCDFCVLYIEHRREIVELLHSNENLQRSAIPGTPAHPPMCARPPSSVKGDRVATMEKLQLNIPDLWADHHVLKVRALLLALPGLQDVVVSSAFRIIALSYDPALISPGVIMAELEEAGYLVATDGAEVIADARRVPVADGHRDPAWTRLGTRQTRTDERDLKTKR